MLKFRDVFDWPMRYLNPYISLWAIWGIVTFVPGFILWALSLGSFRYFNITSKVCDYLVNKDIDKKKANGTYDWM